LDDSNNGKGINISEDKSFFGSGCFSLKMEKDVRIKRIAMGQGTAGGRQRASEREGGGMRLSVLKIIPEEENPFHN
jgi:hypothetical protein